MTKMIIKGKCFDLVSNSLKQEKLSCEPISNLYENNKFILEAQNLSNDGKHFQESKKFQ